MTDTGLSKAEVFRQLANLIEEGCEEPWEEFEWSLGWSDWFTCTDGMEDLIRQAMDEDYKIRRTPEPKTRTVWLVWEEEGYVNVYDALPIPDPQPESGDKACKKVVITEGEFDND